MGDLITILAPAKVNLFLRVLERRPDGFHELETLFQAVALHDVVHVQVASDDEIHLVVEGADVGPPEDNLAYRAALAYMKRARVAAGLMIRLEKNIPAGAGLGGGSSDAAAVLKALNAAFGSPLADADLISIGATLGSDVPFFLGAGPTAVGRGRGEQLEAVPALPEAHLVLALPPVHVATGQAYQALSQRGLDSGGRRLGDPPASWAWVTTLAHNDFQAVVAEQHPEVATALAALEDVGGDPVLLSGSGAACFGRFSSASLANAAAEALTQRLGFPCVAADTLTAFPALNRMGDTG